MHVPREERVAAWLAAADSDLAAAVTIREETAHLACFHAQQATENALKAVVTHLSGDAPPVHAAVRLIRALDELACPMPADVRDRAESLDKFYVPTRYPDALGFVDAALAYKPRDADLAIEGARLVVEWSRTISSPSSE